MTLAQSNFEFSLNELNASSEIPGKEWGYQAFTNAIQTDLKNGISEMLAGNITTDELIENIDQIAAGFFSRIENIRNE